VDHLAFGSTPVRKDGAVEMHDVMRQRRNALNLSQADLAERVGVDRRQIRRYEAGDTQPALSTAKAIARVLGISIDELAGVETDRVDLTGHWWACWQSWKGGIETINPQEVDLRQQGDVIQIVSATRGTPLVDGGYLWRGELRVRDHQALMGWYVADEGPVQSKGAMYFILQPGTGMVGRWVGLSHDGPIISGWGVIATGEREVTDLMDNLREGGTAAVL